MGHIISSDTSAYLVKNEFPCINSVYEFAIVFTYVQNTDILRTQLFCALSRLVNIRLPLLNMLYTTP